MNEYGLVHRIEEILENLRPNIQMDGGDIKFVRFEDGVVYVRMLGACIGCPVSSYTLKLGIEDALKEQISEVREVVAVNEDEA